MQNSFQLRIFFSFLHSSFFFSTWLIKKCGTGAPPTPNIYVTIMQIDSEPNNDPAASSFFRSRVGQKTNKIIKSNFALAHLPLTLPLISRTRNTPHKNQWHIILNHFRTVIRTLTNHRKKTENQVNKQCNYGIYRF